MNASPRIGVIVQTKDSKITIVNDIRRTHVRIYRPPGSPCSPRLSMKTNVRIGTVHIGNNSMRIRERAKRKPREIRTK